MRGFVFLFKSEKLAGTEKSAAFALANKVSIARTQEHKYVRCLPWKVGVYRIKRIIISEKL